ncbi:Hypothetical_protein [Hexamita inflata]|uniref:Hypothetical_protein n=1 Tax=Hexamita inflata TaxID=28002 RepID=A0AA86UB89_9EUKA|nr:Hypothetical protein HINF_LOCUS38535 [Hexamita inflata]
MDMESKSEQPRPKIRIIGKVKQPEDESQKEKQIDSQQVKENKPKITILKTTTSSTMPKQNNKTIAPEDCAQQYINQQKMNSFEIKVQNKPLEFSDDKIDTKGQALQFSDDE